MSKLKDKEAKLVADSPLQAKHLKDKRQLCNESLNMPCGSRSIITNMGIPHTHKTGGPRNARKKASESQGIAHQQKAPNGADQKFNTQGNLSARNADAENAGTTSNHLSSTSQPDFQYAPPNPRAHGTIVMRGGFWEPPAKSRPPEWEFDEEARKAKVWKEFQEALNEIRMEAAEIKKRMSEQEAATAARRLKRD